MGLSPGLNSGFGSDPEVDSDSALDTGLATSSGGTWAAHWADGDFGLGLASDRDASSGLGPGCSDAGGDGAADEAVGGGEGGDIGAADVAAELSLRNPPKRERFFDGLGADSVVGKDRKSGSPPPPELFPEVEVEVEGVSFTGVLAPVTGGVGYGVGDGWTRCHAGVSGGTAGSCSSKSAGGADNSGGGGGAVGWATAAACACAADWVGTGAEADVRLAGRLGGIRLRGARSTTSLPRAGRAEVLGAGAALGSATGRRGSATPPAPSEAGVAAALLPGTATPPA